MMLPEGGVLPYCWVLIPFLNSGRTSLSPAAFAIPKPDAFGDRARSEIRTRLQNFTAFSLEQVDLRQRPRMKSIDAGRHWPCDRGCLQAGLARRVPERLRLQQRYVQVIITALFVRATVAQDAVKVRVNAVDGLSRPRPRPQSHGSEPRWRRLSACLRRLSLAVYHVFQIPKNLLESFSP
jgi:hypothetical protein